MSTYHFPTLFSGKAARYPVSRTITFQTNVTRFLNFTEQRFRQRVRLDLFLLQFRHIKGSDLTTLLAFFDARKGRYSADWDLGLDETPAGADQGTFENLHFLNDTLAYSEERAERYTLSIEAQQISAPMVATTDPGAFPVLASGARVQRPYRVTRSFFTLQNNMAESGYAYGAALRNTPLLSWELPYSLLIPADVQAIEAHFLNAEGRYKTFPFTGPDGVLYSKVRYASDILEIQYVGPNQATATVLLEEAA